MREQLLKFKSGQPIVISTAHGIVEIYRIKNNTRELRFILPNGVKAFKGQDRARSPVKFALKIEEEE